MDQLDLTAYLETPPAVLAGRRALVTGASAGIGLATACRLAEAGVHLKLTGRRQARLEALKQALEQRFPEISVAILAADLALPESWDALAESGFYEVDILINNAGLAHGRDKVEQASFADWQPMIDVNVTAAFEITRRIVPGMLARGQGDIVCLGSAAGIYPYEGGSVYCAAKAALRSFCQILRRETAGRNLRVMLMSPGMVATEFSSRRLGSEAAGSAVYAGMTPLTETDVARQILFGLNQPRHINWDELLLMATDQGWTDKVVRQGV